MNYVSLLIFTPARVVSLPPPAHFTVYTVLSARVALNRGILLLERELDLVSIIHTVSWRAKRGSVIEMKPSSEKSSKRASQSKVTVWWNEKNAQIHTRKTGWVCASPSAPSTVSAAGARCGCCRWDRDRKSL